jgi:hypothetical protein
VTSASYQVFEDDWTPGGARVEVVTAVVTEYGTQYKGGDRDVWNTEPHVERAYPLAKRIEEALLNGAKVYRRRVIVVQDWAEVSEP